MSIDLNPNHATRLTIYIGDAYRGRITVKDSSNVAVSLTNVTAMKLRIKISPEDSDSSAVLTKAIDITDVDHTLASGIIALKLTSAETTLLTAGTYYWSIRLTRSTLSSPRNIPIPFGIIVAMKTISTGA